MACDECGELNTHQFRSSSDLVRALQVAAAEVDRGALERIDVSDLSIPEQVALRSALASGRFPDVVFYRFKCTVCGDLFALSADTEEGRGGWTRNDEAAA
nr:hypothetical protein [uncultured bacterium]